MTIRLDAPTLALLALVALAFVAFVVFLLRRRPDASAGVLQAVSQDLGFLRAEVTALARAQDDLRQETQRSRESAFKDLSDATAGLKGEIGNTHRALAEVKALEQGRARQQDVAAESLRRLESVVAGAPTRGAAGENILMRSLAQLPADLLESNVSFGNKVVEYALRLPGQRYLPIDSKWTSVASLERLDVVEDPIERRKLVEQVAREVRSRVKDMTKYLDPERTLGIAMLAVPDAVYVAAPEAHSEGYREGILMVPYSLALPYLLTVYRLVVRFGATVDTDEIAARLRRLGECLRRVDEEIEGRLSRGIVQVANARDSMREHVADARGVAERLLRTAETAEDVEPAPRLALVDRD